MDKFAPTFMKLMYDEEVFSDEFLIKWYNRKSKLDKHCAMYDRDAEKAFRGLIAKFIEWLQQADENEEEDGEDDEEEDEEAAGEKPEKTEKVQKTAAPKNETVAMKK